MLSDDKRKALGVDVLTITPPDAAGRKFLAVFVAHATKLTSLVVLAAHTALEVARACFQVFARYGVYEYLVSDPGTEFKNDLIKHLTSWFGIRQRFSLVERHESNGVEHSNAAILRHLQALVLDNQCIKDQWSLPENICMVEYILNSSINSETGFTPFQLHFGTDDLQHLQLPTPFPTDAAKPAQYLEQLDATLKHLWQLSRAHQQSVISKRTSLSAGIQQSFYARGDLVLLEREEGKRSKPAKLDALYLGPYEVLQHQDNDVEVRHLASHIVTTYHVERFKPFFGSLSEAVRLARSDLDHHLIIAIHSYRGDPTTRTSLEFLTEFATGVSIWKRWDLELFATIAYEDFCRSRHELALLLYPLKRVSPEPQPFVASQLPM